ncbi:MFS-type efflux pump MFS1 [Exophiala dermatitidis]
MASFAPAYQQESNDTWLNGIVQDIISSGPARRVASRSRSRSLHTQSVTSRSRSRSLHTQSSSERQRVSVQSEDDVDDVDQESPVAGVGSDLARGRQPIPSHARGMSDSSFFSDATLPSIPPPAYGQVTCPSEKNSSFFQRQSSDKTSTRSAVSSVPAANFPETSYVPSRRGVWARQQQNQTADSKSKAVHFDNTRNTLIEPVRRLSTVSEFSGFESHPAVRPLETKKGLGEAAGPTPADDPTQYPGPLALASIVIGICLSVFIISLDRNIITTAIPDITARFHSYEDIGWYGSAYLLTASAFQPLYGRVYMSFETKSSFLLAQSVFEAGSLVAALCPSSEVLIVGRAIQGLGSAGLLTGAFVVGTHSVRLQQRPVLFAAVGILYGIGALCGPLLGGAFTDTIGWRWCFWINLPIGAVTFITVFFCFKHRPPTDGSSRPPFVQRVLQLDLIGNIILLAATTMLFLALQFSEQRYSWSSARCVGLLCGFGVTTLIFIAWMFYRGDAALIPPRIARQRTVAASCGAAFLIYGALLVHSYYLPIWFQAIKGASAIHSGVNMIPYMVANAVFSLLAGIFVSKNGRFAPPAILGCAIGTIGSGFLATLDESTPSSRWIGFEFLISAGLGMAIQQGFSAVQAVLPLEEVPIGTAAVVASQSLGGAIFVSVGNTLLQDHLLKENNAGSSPGVNIRAVFELGATRFRDIVPPADLPALIKLYNDSLQAVFIAAVPLCGAAFLCSLCMEWRSLKRALPEQGAGREKV